MKWFKFYGQDFITDSKLSGLNPYQRLMWVVLLCMASQDEKKSGILPFFKESRLLVLAGLNYDDMKSMYGVKPNETIETFCNMGLVSWIDQNTLLVTNYYKKQTQQSTSTERVLAYRERIKAKKQIKDDVTDVTNVTLQSNARIDKNRIDKNILLQKKEKNMRTYGEQEFQDAGEKVLDLDIGEIDALKEIKIKHLGYDPKETNILLAWGIKKIGRKFAQPLKQKKHIASMLAAGNTPEVIMAKWEELEDDDFWKEKGIDFSIVASQIDKVKPIKKPNPLLYAKR